MDFKKKPHTRGLNPYLLSIILILLYTARDFSRFCITDGQSSSAADITLPMYLKEVTYQGGAHKL